MEKKLDLKKEYKRYYNPSPRTPEIIEIPAFQYLMIDGVNAGPGSEPFQYAIEALFGVSYKAKFTIKKEQGIDYTVMPLEGLWWADDMNDFITGNKERWRWTLMIMQPDFVTSELVQISILEVKKSKGNPVVDLLRLEEFKEGLSAQIMHIGPFAEEHSNIIKIHQSISENGGHFDGQKYKHHEIYLNDFRKIAPEKMKTILRQPFCK